MKRLSLLLFVCLSSSLFADTTEEYSDKGMLVGESRQQIATERPYNNMPMIVDEERTYGQLEIKKPEVEVKKQFDFLAFQKAYNKAGQPKVIFFIDDNFNDAIAVHGGTKNKIENNKLIRENIIDERQEYSRNAWMERRWKIQDSLTNEFLDAGVQLVDRKVIVRLAESKEYRKGLPKDSKESLSVSPEMLTYIKTGNNLSIDMLNNVIEMDALNEYVDYIIEVKISNYSKYKYPTLRAKILNLKTGMYLGSVSQNHDDSINEVEEYVATNSGYQKIKKEVYKNAKEKEYIETNSGYVEKASDDEIELEEYSKDFAHKLMEKFEKGI